MSDKSGSDTDGYTSETNPQIIPIKPSRKGKEPNQSKSATENRSQPEANSSQSEASIPIKKGRTEKQKQAFLKCKEARDKQVESLKGMKREDKEKIRLEKKAQKLKNVFETAELKSVIMNVISEEREARKGSKVKKPNYEQMLEDPLFEKKIKDTIKEEKLKRKTEKQMEKQSKQPEPNRFDESPQPTVNTSEPVVEVPKPVVSAPVVKEPIVPVSKPKPFGMFKLL